VVYLRNLPTQKKQERGKTEIKKPETITKKQAESIIRRLDYRERLLIRLAIESGLRISDILKLKVGDIKKTMTVYESKSKKFRTFKISEELYAELKKMTRYKKKASVLFYSARQPTKAMHRSTIHRKIKTALKPLKFNASAHSMRKLYAHTVFAETHDLKKVQEALNHKHIFTTCAYLDIDVEKLIVMSQEGSK